MCILNYEIIVFRNSNNRFSNHFQTQRMFTTHAPFMSIKSIFNPDWLQYNLRNEFGYVARPVPNSIRNFFPSLTSICPIVEFGFDQLEASKMQVFLDHMSYAYRHWQLRSPINFFNFYSLGSPRFNTGYTLVRRRKCTGCSLFIRWLLFLATSITNSDS